MLNTTRWYCRLFLISSCLLLLIGLLFVYSASSVYALEHHGSAAYFAKRHMLGMLLGCIAACIMRLLPLGFIRFCTPIAFITSLVVTALTLLPHYAVRIHGSNRWLKLFGFSFQPSELLKIGFVWYLAYLLAKKEYRLQSFKDGYLPFLCMLIPPTIILLLQPDFGLTVTLIATTFIMLFIAGARISHLLATFLSCLPAVGILILYRPYRLRRIMTFLNPWADPQGAGFQIIQSLIAIGSGGWFGVGIGNSKQKFFYLPMQHTDFIFSIIAEEIGFIGSGGIIFLFMILLYSGIKLAWSIRNSFGRYSVLSFVILITLQTLINLAVTMGLVPTKGIGLPFISYGNTSLVCTIAMLGLISNIAHNQSSKHSQ